VQRVWEIWLVPFSYANIAQEEDWKIKPMEMGRRKIWK